MSIEAIELALEALRKAMQGNLVFDEAMEAFKSLEKSLAQPEQEPVAWYHAEDYKTHFTTNPSPDLIGKYWKPLYTTPPQPKEPKQEQGAPVAVVTGVYGGRFTYAPIKASVILPVGMALYTRPQPRTWVELTDGEIEARAINFYNPEMYKRAVLWAQEKLKERNQ